MHAARAFLNGAGAKRPKSRRAERKLLAVINMLWGMQAGGQAGLIPVIARPVRRPLKPRP